MENAPGQQKKHVDLAVQKKGGIPSMLEHLGATLSFQPRIRKGAFFEAAWRHGCRQFSVYNRTYISGCFHDPEVEYWSVVNDVALWPTMGERQIEITGPDAAEFVQRLTPRNLSNWEAGQCKYALITDQFGGILSDPIMLQVDQGRYWLSTSDCDLELWAKGVAVHSGLSVNIRDAEIGVCQVQGPKSAQLLSELFGDVINELRYYRLGRVNFEGTELIVSRTGWSGEFGFELYLSDHDKADALFDTLMEQGKPHNICPGCVSQARRIESGILSCGLDMGVEENPYEIGLERLVDVDMARDFVGKSALARLKHEPLKKKLVGLFVDGERLPGNEVPWKVQAQGKVVGKLTSLVFSPQLQRNIGLALLKTEYAEVETEVEVETIHGLRNAHVGALPFVPKKQLGASRSAG